MWLGPLAGQPGPSTLPGCLTLSKQTRRTFPQRSMRWGLTQKMPWRFSLLWAYMVPIVIAAGKAGGTTTVTTSRARRAISHPETCEW